MLVAAELKTHQQRRVALDADTSAILREHVERARSRAATLGHELQSDAFLFSGSPDGSTFAVPDSVTQRYDRLAARLGIATTFHRLRHYSATELIAARVDPRTGAGRLGHGGGGATTLKTYSAWVSEADQRAPRRTNATAPTDPSLVKASAQSHLLPATRYAGRLICRFALAGINKAQPRPSYLLRARSRTGGGLRPQASSFVTLSVKRCAELLRVDGRTRRPWHRLGTPRTPRGYTLGPRQGRASCGQVQHPPHSQKSPHRHSC